MSGIPTKCPKCGNTKAWKENVNPFKAGVPTPFGRVRTGIVVKGLFSKPIERAMGLRRVIFRCHRCGFQKEYDLSD